MQRPSAMHILFITSTRIGDAVLTSGLLAHLIETYPESLITVACGTTAAPLFAHTPNIETVLPMTKRRGGGHWLGLWTRVVQRKWDIVVDLRGSAMAYFLWARRRHVYTSSNNNLHRVDSLGRLLSLSPPPSPRVWPGESARDRARIAVPFGPPVFALGPTANSKSKIWPQENFAALIKELTEGENPLFPHARIAIFSAPEERSEALPLFDVVPPDRRIDVAGTVDLPTAYACLERMDFFVGNDSGLMHLAAAAGVPTLGLFGPTRESLYAPWGPHTMAIRGEESYEEIIGAPNFYFGMPETCMRGLSVEKAVRAVRELWERQQGRRT
jgi:ADP-heptose:LPS heptosyltransferase